MSKENSAITHDDLSEQVADEKVKQNYFCYMPFSSLAIYPNQTIKICCKSHPLKNNQQTSVHTSQIKSLQDFFLNNEHLKKIRQQFLNGEKPIECKNCWDMESKGYESLRQTFARKHYSNESLKTNPKIYFLDLRLSNKCNLRCIMCDENHSSQIAKEKNIENFETKHEKHFIDNIYENLTNIKEIYFAGGESLLIEEHYKILDYLIQKNLSKNIVLKYSTNITTIKKSWLDSIVQFKKVKINASIDASSDLIYYIRYPLKWEKIEKNFNLLYDFYLKNDEKIILSIDTCLHCLNIHELPILINWVKKFKGVDLNFLRTVYPKFLHIHVLPNDAKKTIEKSISNITKIDNLSKNPNILNVILYDLQKNPTEDTIENFKKYIMEKDHLRNLNILDYAPHFKEWF